MANEDFERRLAALEAEQADLRAQRDVTAVQLADLAKQIGQEFASALRGPSPREMVLMAMRHTWVDATTYDDRAAGLARAICTRCGVKSRQAYGSAPESIGACPGRHPDDHTT